VLSCLKLAALHKDRHGRERAVNASGVDKVRNVDKHSFYPDAKDKQLELEIRKAVGDE